MTNNDPGYKDPAEETLKKKPEEPAEEDAPDHDVDRDEAEEGAGDSSDE